MTNNKSNTNLKPKIKSAFRQAGGYVTRKDIGKAIPPAPGRPSGI